METKNELQEKQNYWSAENKKYDKRLAIISIVATAAAGMVVGAVTQNVDVLEAGACAAIGAATAFGITKGYTKSMEKISSQKVDELKR